MALKKKKRATSAGMAENCCGPSKPYVPIEERKNGPFEDYDLRDALSTLVRASKIRKNPKLMAAIRAEAQKQVKAASTTVSQLGD